MSLKIKDLEGLAGEIIETQLATSGEKVLVYEKGKMQIIREVGYIYIKDLDMDIYNGYIYKCSPRTLECKLLSSVYLFYEHDTNNFIYGEHVSSLPNAILNYCEKAEEPEVDSYDKVNNLEFEFIMKRIRNKWKSDTYDKD